MDISETAQLGPFDQLNITNLLYFQNMTYFSHKIYKWLNNHLYYFKVFMVYP